MHAVNALVKDQGVGDDGAGHAARLRHVAHAQQAGNLHGDGLAVGVHLVQDFRRRADALLQGAGCIINRPLRHGEPNAPDPLRPRETPPANRTPESD